MKIEEYTKETLSSLPGGRNFYYSTGQGVYFFNDLKNPGWIKFGYSQNPRQRAYSHLRRIDWKKGNFWFINVNKCLYLEYLIKTIFCKYTAHQSETIKINMKLFIFILKDIRLDEIMPEKHIDCMLRLYKKYKLSGAFDTEKQVICHTCKRFIWCHNPIHQEYLDKHKGYEYMPSAFKIIPNIKNNMLKITKHVLSTKNL
jgi:hypothetical protein